MSSGWNLRFVVIFACWYLALNKKIKIPTKEKKAHLAEWSKAMVLSCLQHHHYRKMREFEPHSVQNQINFFGFTSSSSRPGSFVEFQALKVFLLPLGWTFLQFLFHMETRGRQCEARSSGSLENRLESYITYYLS